MLRVRALVVSRIAGLERDLRLECASFLDAASSGQPRPSEPAGFELELVTYAPPSAASQADDEAEARKLVALLRESEVVVADPALVAPHLRHLVAPAASGGNLRWMQSTWAGVDSLFRALGHDDQATDHKPVPHARTHRTHRTGD
jgi:hypothetical protein